MNRGDLLFVYGTLRPGNGAHDLFMSSGVEHIGETRISGRMYSMGGFPGVRLDGRRFHSEGDVVTGDLFRITDDNLSSRLDQYEGYPHLYGRRLVETEQGEDAWVYEINMAPPETSRIPSGTWGE